MSTPVLHLLAGPNGAGKTTFAQQVLEPTTRLPFVNADVIAAQRWPGDEVARAYDASSAAAALRAELLAGRRSFITETVFSHPSKVDLVQHGVSLGYLVTLHVIVIPVELALYRVEHRVRTGGHAVPQSKIRDRYDRLWPLVAAARDIANTTVFYDNTRAATPFSVVGRFHHGQPVGTPHWPTWTPQVLRKAPPPAA